MLYNSKFTLYENILSRINLSLTQYNKLSSVGYNQPIPSKTFKKHQFVLYSKSDSLIKLFIQKNEDDLFFMKSDLILNKDFLYSITESIFFKKSSS
jgi:hypothetical protein